MFNRISGSLSLTTLLALGAILVSGTLVPTRIYAQESATVAPVVQVSSQNGGSMIALELPIISASDRPAGAVSLPMVPYGGYLLPMQFLTLAVPEGVTPTVQMQRLTASDLPNGIEPASPLLPPALDWEPSSGVQATPLQLPDAPVFIVREGRIHGQRFVVVAVGPVYRQNDVVKIASSVQAFAAGATPLHGDVLASTAGTIATEVVTVPINQAALKHSYKVIVSKAGIQEVLYSQLGQASAPGNLLLSLDGQPVALEKLPDRLRFYVPAVGDRWNLTSVYWLTLENGPVMTTPAPAPVAPAGIAYARGRWVDNKLYDSIYPGADDDHWFNMTMRAAPGMNNSEIVTANVPISMTLPGRGESSTYTVYVTALVAPRNDFCSAGDNGYRLEAKMQSGSNTLESQTQAWNPAPGCVMQPSSAVSFATTANADNLQVRLLPNTTYDTGVNLDSVAWERPVTLDFGAAAAQRGADFWTRAGAATFSLANLPAPWQLYNITAPDNPQIVASGGSHEAQFNQAADAPPSHYMLVNLEALHRPTVQVHSPIDFGNVLAADAIYIGPAAFADELSPLIARRQQQGYTPLFVDVQKIFDVYDYGHISAVAIRNFLRHQTDWQNPARHLSVVLVGDGSYDPYNYEGKNDAANNDANRVPPYMADVDPFIREAPCEQCYAQLNGDDPRTGDNGAGNGGSWFAADIWLGRFPVRSEQETAGVVAKIIAYETTGNINDLWRSRHVFLADNFIKAIDNADNADADEAGDFAAIADTITQLLPTTSQPQRIYLDAAPTRRVVTTNSGALIPAPNKPGYYLTEARKVQEPWRTANLDAANAAAISSLGGGAGLVVFNGHSNHWQYARMEGKSEPNWLLYTNDADLLNNFDRLFIGLSMTCYTAQFAKPAANGTLDEVLFRRKEGGAVAMWGSSGLSVVHGHDQLQRGFMKRLWSAPAGSQRLGELVEAGYTELLTNSGDCCQDVLKTFLLLGDPLTNARVAANAGLYLPSIQKK